MQTSPYNYDNVLIYIKCYMFRPHWSIISGAQLCKTVVRLMHGVRNILFINFSFFQRYQVKQYLNKAWTDTKGSRMLRLSDFKAFGI